MKHFGLLLTVITFLFLACQSEPKGDRAETGEAFEEQALIGDNSFSLEQGVVFWTGYGVGKQHTGTIKITDAQLFTKDKELIGGSFVFDLNTLEVTDLTEDKGKSDLEKHLRSGDFFQADEYPTGKFLITSVSPITGKEGVTHEILGNLTIKDITRGIRFEAEIVADGNSIRAKTPDFVINRTEWNVMYGSDLIGTAKEKLISNDVTLAIGLNGRRNAN